MVFRCQTNCKHQPFILTQPYSHGVALCQCLI